MSFHLLPGQTYPLGATVYPTGVNFCIYSKNCKALELLLFDDPQDPDPAHVIHLDPVHHKTFYYWHVFVTGIGAGQIFAYRAYGPFAPEKGHRFDGAKVLLDPYTKGVVWGPGYRRDSAIAAGDNCAHALRGVVVDPRTYDWEGDQHPQIPYSRTIIYELHVGGFTRDQSSGLPAHQRGTYEGIIAKIPYLKDLGITAVELLPVQQFDPQDAPQGLANYWGYSPIAFFAPHAGYSSRQDPLGPVDEFRDMVKALHRENIEVILDVVFNHTAEADAQGPTLSMRGLENASYYILKDNPAEYADFTGCGNTLKANNSIVRRMIIDCLDYWVHEMHVDGFRFDLASVMARDEVGHPIENPPILWAIESDPGLASTKIIAEAWDAAGLYQVGTFIGDRFAEWNGQFRDDVRCFLRGDKGMINRLAARIIGSPDLYTAPDREPNRSIHLVTCHDGFTLADLVSYSCKHNEANGENNRDGANDNFSWNCGLEGPTQDPDIEKLRKRQIKNFISLLFLSQGTPMLLMGDEVRRSQQGNNNAYCQDNPLSWFNWDLVSEQAELLRFTRELIHFIQSQSIFIQEQLLKDHEQEHEPYILWHGIHLHQPDWGYNSHSLAFTLRDPLEGVHLHVMLNAFWEPLTFEIPLLRQGQVWGRILDTSLPPPQDFCRPEKALAISTDSYPVQAHSVTALMARHP
ncbi:MAG: glycogen debranching protein GlgX [Synechococcaceae cyanobacterium SM2_3_1]|nr:glycogen debranching protein GlgX [Synechococcaceae cyanobacterium SM2_3_1]